MYELMPNKTKIWRSDLCSVHEKIIAESSRELRKEHELIEFREVKTNG